MDTAVRLYTLKQAAERLQLSTRTLRRWLDRGLLRAIKLGQQWRVSEQEVRRLEEQGVDIEQ